MKVHLIKTPDYSNEARTEVLQLLQDTGIGLQFQEGDWEEIEEADLPPLFSFENIWKLCNNYRTQSQVPPEDFVVLLTSIRNEHNFFSYFDEDLNAFVHTDDWDYFGIGNTAYPIAYEVAANVLQRLMHLTGAHIHEDSVGCMNDMCENKKDVLLKLRTADICPGCLKEIERQEVSEDIISQVLHIFEKVRAELMWAQGFRRNLKAKKLEITREGRIKIGGKLILKDPMSCTLMIFFLKHLNGIRLNDLGGFEDELVRIYLVVGKNAEDVARKRMKEIALPHQKNNKFSTYRNRLNNKLTQKLGDSQPRFYHLIRQHNGVFRVQGPIAEITDNFLM